MSKVAIPVVDGGQHEGGDIYGYATTKRGAMRVANRYFADPVARIEDYEWIPGQPAFLALTIYGAGEA